VQSSGGARGRKAGHPHALQRNPQNIFLYGIYITATGADASVRISIDDGDDGEAVPFGTQRISANGAAWERTGAPLYVARGGNNLYIRVTGSPGSVIQINAVAKR
jgi:hypothetical protein